MPVWPTPWPSEPPSAAACVLRGTTKVGMLATELMTDDLHGEIAGMVAHYTEPLVFGRVGGKLSIITVRDYIKSSREVLGLLHHLKGDATISLRAIGDGELLHAFVSKKMQTDVSSTAQSKTYGHLVKVLTYIRVRDADQLTATQVDALGVVIRAMDTCKSQIRTMAIPKIAPTVDDMRAAGTHTYIIWFTCMYPMVLTQGGDFGG
jgi:hypothetical protein